jgi:hypothetical protein
MMVMSLVFIVLGDGTAPSANTASSNIQIGPLTVYGHVAPSGAKKA